jgi:hypothetical protein
MASDVQPATSHLSGQPSEQHFTSIFSSKKWVLTYPEVVVILDIIL